MATGSEPRLHRTLPRDFYERPVDEVARDLLGCSLVHRIGRRFVGGRIVETEAYGGPGDPGSHADKAPDGRARIMFGPPGTAYVYFTYGMHHCLNAVSHPEGGAGAVLIRALEPVWGTAAMREAGAPASLAEHKLAAGPGRLCRALGLDRRHNGLDLTTAPLRILEGAPQTELYEGTRIGLSTDDGRRWRYWMPSRSVSRSPRAGTRR